MGKSHKSRKNASEGQRQTAQSYNSASTANWNSTSACRTLEDDGFTQCRLPATDGNPKIDRCRVHHQQFQILCAKYKEASKLVDEVKGGYDIPTKDEIAGYEDVHAISEKARWMRKYLEAIRVEKTGREIHMRRFFPKGGRVAR